MKTVLKIKSNYSIEETEINDRLKDFVQHMTGDKEWYVEFVTNDKYDISCPSFCFEYDDHDSLKKIISLFSDHRYVPFDEFEDITNDDFTMALESNTINESFGFLSEKNLEYVEEQVNMLDYICSDIVHEQEDLKEKMEAMYSFFDKSGILYYKQLIQGLLEVLDSKGIIEKENIEKKLFTNVH